MVLFLSYHAIKISSHSYATGFYFRFHLLADLVAYVCLHVCFCSPSGKGILSGHADGSVVRYFLEDEGSGETQVSTCSNK